MNTKTIIIIAIIAAILYYIVYRWYVNQKLRLYIPSSYTYTSVSGGGYKLSNGQYVGPTGFLCYDPTQPYNATSNPESFGTVDGRNFSPN